MANDWKEQCQYCGKRMGNIDEAMEHANNCSELKPCPFCGGEVEFLTTTLGEFSSHHWIKGIQCKNADCKAQTLFFRGSFNVSDMSMPREIQKANIAERWNERV